MTTDTGPDTHVLVVDDDQRLRQLLTRYLSDNGYIVTAARDVPEARQLMALFAFDILIVDVMMPGVDGRSFTAEIRRTSGVPILMLTAMGDSDDRIAGLEVGADDYIAKPFEPRELLLRMGSILRRASVDRAHSQQPQPLLLGQVIYDPTSGHLTRANKPLRLTPAEAELIAVLAARPGETLSREDLAAALGGEGTLRSIDVQVTRLRKKIEPDPKLPRYLQTIRGKGYRLIPD